MSRTFTPQHFQGNTKFPHSSSEALPRDLSPNSQNRPYCLCGKSSAPESGRHLSALKALGRPSLRESPCLGFLIPPLQGRGNMLPGHPSPGKFISDTIATPVFVPFCKKASVGSVVQEIQFTKFMDQRLPFLPFNASGGQAIPYLLFSSGQSGKESEKPEPMIFTQGVTLCSHRGPELLSRPLEQPGIGR